MNYSNWLFDLGVSWEILDRFDVTWKKYSKDNILKTSLWKRVDTLEEDRSDESLSPNGPFSRILYDRCSLQVGDGSFFCGHSHSEHPMNFCGIHHEFHEGYPDPTDFDPEVGDSYQVNTS